MDTDDLSRDAYNAIIIEAEKFHHDLTLQFGVLSSKCKTENDYLVESMKMINNWMTQWNINELIDEIFYDNPPQVREFRNCLLRILKNIDNVQNIPIDNRTFDEL